MKYKLLAAVAALVISQGSFADQISSTTFTVSSNWNSLSFAPDGTIISDQGVASAYSESPPASSSDQIDVTFLALPGFQITGVSLYMDLSSYTDTWSGPEYDSNRNPTSVSAQAYYYSDSNTVAVPGGFEVTGNVNLYAQAASFCLYPDGVCLDGINSMTLTAGAYLNYLQFTVDVSPLASPVPEPGVPVMFATGLGALALRRRFVRSY